MPQFRQLTPKRRTTRVLALLLPVLLLAAACGDGDPDDDGFDGTVRLGAALSETGRFAMEGSDSRQGYDTWARWVNEEYGGIRIGDARYRAEIVYYDDESDADIAAELVQQVIDEDEIHFLLGPYSSGLTGPASAVAEANGVIMVEGNGTSDTLFDRGFRNLFLVATIATDYTRSGIEAFAAQGAQTAVIAYEDTPFATSVAGGARHHLEANGIEVLAVEAYPEGVADVSDLVARLGELMPDVFIGGGHYNDAVLFLQSAQELGIRSDAMLITVGPSNPQLVDDLGASVNGVLGPTQWEPAMAYEGSYFGSAADYADYYESLWGNRPSTRRPARLRPYLHCILPSRQRAASIPMTFARPFGNWTSKRSTGRSASTNVASTSQDRWAPSKYRTVKLSS